TSWKQILQNGPQNATAQTMLTSGAPEEIRTPDPQIRSLVLYPAELRARLAHRAGSVPEPSKSGGNAPLAIGFGREWQGSAREAPGWTRRPCALCHPRAEERPRRA